MNIFIKKVVDFIRKNSNIIIIVFLLFTIFLFVDDIVGKSVLKDSPYNSYVLQAKAWLNGRTYLDHDYSYLELALYKGKYFVSFPPFPSVFLLPFVFIFHDNIPTNLISFFLFTFNFILIYRILKRFKNNDVIAIFLASAFTVGTSFLSLAIDSGVWFFAQLLNNTLCLLAVDSFLKNRKIMLYTFLSLAVGCRPFSIIYILMFLIYYALDENEDVKIIQSMKNNYLPLIPSIIIGICYMVYNYIRFDNVLEFGHNYLPEFIEYKQFSFSYLLPNLKDLLFTPILIDDKLNLSFYTPFSCFLANPIITVYIYRNINIFLKKIKFSKLQVLIFIFTCINVLLICMHRTLGAWQFGSRYICDILPFVFLGIIGNEKKRKVKLDKFEIMCILFGIIINMFGTIIMYKK